MKILFCSFLVGKYRTVTPPSAHYSLLLGVWGSGRQDTDVLGSWGTRDGPWGASQPREVRGKDEPPATKRPLGHFERCS